MSVLNSSFTLLPALTDAYSVRVGRERQLFSAYGPARTEFHELASEGVDLHTVTVWQRSENQREWWLISLANPCPAGRRGAGGVLPAYVNLFAGMTLSPLFFLSGRTRGDLAALDWHAPGDAAQWEQAVAHEVPPDLPPVREVSPDPDIAALAADPRCRVDAADLERRLRGGWDLDRAMATPLVPRPRSEGPIRWVADPKRGARRRYLH
jgi:hypothetical protein